MKKGNTVIYYNSIKDEFYTTITTSKGDLHIPLIGEENERFLKEEGWHLLREEYYGATRVDVFVGRAYEEAKSVVWKVFEDRYISTTDWWCDRCGEMVPPYEWDGGYYAKGVIDFVVAWKPSKKRKNGDRKGGE